MSDSWERIRADVVVMEWVDKLKAQDATFSGNLGGREDLVGLIEDALEESYRRGAKMDPKEIKRSPDCCGCPSFPYALCPPCHRFNY